MKLNKKISCDAFNNLSPPQEYVELAQDIIRYSGGLPLALVTLGSHLQGRSSVFLHIACTFNGCYADEVTKILNACGFYSESAISTLVQRNLLQRDWPYLVMHDLVRDMGREIVRRESTRDFGKRSRLFNPQEGFKKVEVLVVEQRALKGMKLSTKAFQKMIKLRVLKIDNLHISGDVELLSKELRWLSWKGCPLKCVPSNFPAEKLVVLNMRGSNIQEFGLNLQVCYSILQFHVYCYIAISWFDDCKRLRSTPNFKGSQSLETLWLQNCSSLKEIHPSIGNLDRLICLMKQSLRINLECNEIPDWCSNKVTAPSICLTMPTVHNKEYKFSGMVLWFVYPLCDVILLQHFIVTVAYICLQLFRGLCLLLPISAFSFSVDFAF
ncbi:disease resistance protein RUN1-like [Solanum verrucosum]|uniref:disease resistance protein RUN1-like n=1 Tax=Solanum verrucosum TaxID=315347 RepID=UPI0020D1A961|nr:disease resistance protein RUN1-like [Solanum verrucosum]